MEPVIDQKAFELLFKHVKFMKDPLNAEEVNFGKEDISGMTKAARQLLVYGRGKFGEVSLDKEYNLSELLGKFSTNDGELYSYLTGALSYHKDNGIELFNYLAGEYGKELKQAKEDNGDIESGNG